MRKTTKFLTLVLAALMIMSVVSMSAGAAFTDVPVENEALSDATELLSTLGVAKGTTDTTFSPDELVTRQQMAAFIYRLMKAGKSQEGGANTTKFTDLEDSTFFYMISWADSSKIIKGTSATTFNPKGNITLQDAYTMMVRALGYEKDGALSYPFEYIDKAEELGLDEDLASSIGYTDALTRGNVAIILANAFYADMNEKTVEYVAKTVVAEDGTKVSGLVAQETTETIASKIFGVKQADFDVNATKHYALDGKELADSNNDNVGGVITYEDGTVIESALYTMKELGLDGSSDDYFLANITLFVKENADKPSHPTVFAAKSNLVVKTVAAADVKLDRSTNTTEKYYNYVDGEKDDNVMTGLVTFGDIKAYIAANAAPYSYVEDLEKDAVKYIDLAAYDYDNGDFTFKVLPADGLEQLEKDVKAKKTTEYTLSDGKKVESYDLIEKYFAATQKVIYNNALYEAQVYDVEGDGYAEYVFVKPYTFVKIDTKKSADFKNSALNKDATLATLYTEKAKVSGSYKDKDYALVFTKGVSVPYVEVKKVITPVASSVVSKSKNTDEEVITLKSGDKFYTLDAADRLANYATKYTYGYFAGKTATNTADYYLYDGVLLLTSAIGGNEEYDANANYGVVCYYKDEPATVYKADNSTATETNNDGTVIEIGEYYTGSAIEKYRLVNILTESGLKTVKLADYAYTHITADKGVIDTDEDIASLDFGKDNQLAETVMAEDFVGKFCSYTVNSEGGYVLTALEADCDLTLNKKDSEDNTGMRFIELDDATIKKFSGNIYNFDGATSQLSRMIFRDYSKMVVKTVDKNNKDVYTVYTASNLPKDMKVENVKALFANNVSGNAYENLGILFCDYASGSSLATEDYRIITGVSSKFDDGEDIKYVTIFDPISGSSVGEVEIDENADPGKFNANMICVLTDDGKVTYAEPYAAGYDKENANLLFKGTLNEYVEDMKCFDIGDGNFYKVTDATKFYYYSTDSNYRKYADTTYLVNGEDNVHYDWKEGTKLNMLVLAEEGDNKDNESIKNAVLVLLFANNNVDTLKPVTK